MAKNRKYKPGAQLSYAVPDGTKSGDPVVVGQIPGVALIDRTPRGTATVESDGVFALQVKGIDGAGNSAIAVGDILYFNAGDVPKISKKATGVRFGYAREAVAAGATATIEVKLGY